MRLKISTLLISLFVGLSLQAQKSEISFQIKNAGVFVNGTFDSVQVVQNFNPEELSLARFKAIIPVSTIYTGIKSRDRHLLKAKYFNQENFPEMVFESTEVNASNKGYQLIGNLTIKSTTKSVDIKFSIEREGEESYYKGYLELDRKDYGVGKKHLLLGDLVRITLKIPVESSGI